MVAFWAIKSSYKGVYNPLLSPIEGFKKRNHKIECYNDEKEYLKKYPEDDLNKIIFQKYVDGRLIAEIDPKKMRDVFLNSLNKDYTIDDLNL